MIMHHQGRMEKFGWRRLDGEDWRYMIREAQVMIMVSVTGENDELTNEVI